MCELPIIIGFGEAVAEAASGATANRAIAHAEASDFVNIGCSLEIKAVKSGN
jgi:hypothetical protein